MIELSPDMLEGMPQNGPTDPIEYYRRPLIGRLFRERINRGLRLLPHRRFERVLEVGYGAGAVQLALAPHTAELHGIDLDADPEIVRRILEAKGHRAQLSCGDVYGLQYDTAHFDLVVSFSVFEHLHEYERALREVHRVLAPGGLFLLGMPAVNKLMEAAFFAIGFRGIDDHHVTTPRAVESAFSRVGFRCKDSVFLDFPTRVPFGVRLYYDWLLEKPLGRTEPVP